MSLTFPPSTKIYLSLGPCDMRKGFDGLSAQVRNILQLDPFSGAVFLFRGKRGDRLKGLVWDGSGLCLYRSAEKNGEWLTLTEAAKKLGVTAHRVRRLIKEGVLPTQQVVPDAPHQIPATDLEKDEVTQFPRHRGPCRIKMENPKSLFPDV